ncbi:formate C-acetyltransferase [Thermobrachium celere]|uniref:Formate acetyltransferase n=1 Tax=Thermobrachium celere DSM 8682 TaxID=941824 RepID=R7RQG1_9CLOT|nr:formate C-acetyltransferase [Thermobrachium celere]GFR34548.1 formate acetyltransferase [Thermobrachium celere]CDF58457.1 Pyruvate formate-lyase [Thermobrachium celere DSM 8682]
MRFNEWHGFVEGRWTEDIDVRDFIQKNYTPYEGDASFLAGPTERTIKLWEQAKKLILEEIKKGIIDLDTDTVSGITAYKPGYLDKENEVIVGFQTDAPLKRIVNPWGGIRMATQAAEAYGYKVNENIVEVFTKYRKTHNQGVFDAYTDEMKLARKSGVITGLPDAYGRGRIIGDYRRLALYGADFLIEKKQEDRNKLVGAMTEETIRLREELTEQIRALQELKEMAASYGYDVSRPAKDAKEAVQWVYFAYLAAIKQQNGAAMSLGRVSTFLDIYIERDLRNGVITEEEAQELIDQFVMKLRLARHLRTPEYNELFAGDPTWITEAIGGMGVDGRTLVTKNSFRFLHTLVNLGPAPEPNMTVLWSTKLPENFKKFCAEMSIKTDSIQYENDDVMRPIFGDDYAIACCVSAMKVGKQMQFFGARANLAKALLYAINGGVDEKLGIQVGPKMDIPQGEYLDYNDVMKRFEKVMEWLAGLYVNTMNVIHYMHDKYAYESLQMALHDTQVERLMAFGIAGLSVAVDSLSAIKYAKVKPIRVDGIAVDFEIEGEFPKYGNDDDRVDQIAVELTEKFINELRKHATYRNAVHTLSVLTITSNVVYGKKTGSTPDGRKKGEPFAPGANPMHGRDIQGALASLNSVAKIPYTNCMDGVSNTFSILPDALGKNMEERVNNLVAIMDGYFAQNAHHLNVNVLNRETLMDAMEHPEKYPTLTIRVSGYAVNFTRLTREQQLDVIKRTFHERI